MAVYEETISLKDGVSGPAMSAAKQVNVLGDAMKATQNAMIKAQATGNVKQYAKLTKELEGYKGALAALPTPTSEAGSSSMGLQAELAELTGGLSAVIEVAAGVGLAFAALVIAGAAVALGANEAQTRMVTLFDALGVGKVSGAAVVDMLDGLGNQLGLTKDKLAPLTKGFLTIGITGTNELRELTIAAAGLNEITAGAAEGFTKLYSQVNAAAQGGSKLTIPYKKLETQLNGMGLNTGDLAKKMGMSQEALTAGLKAGTVDAKEFGEALKAAATDKGAGPLARAGNSIANIWAKAQESFTDLFKDLQPAIDPFLAEVRSLFDVLGQGKDSGKALKAGVGSFFKEVFVQATKVVPYIKHFLLDLVILGLKAYIALKPIIAWVKDLAKNQAVVAVFWAVMKGLGIAALTVGVALGVVIAVVVGLAAALIAIQVAIVAVGLYILGFVADAGGALTGWVAGAAKAAYDFVAGLVDGIKNGAGAVVDAVKGLASGASNAFKNALGIHSPSKVMMAMGGHVAGGAAEGISAGTPDVHAASNDLAKAAAGGFASGGADASGGTGGAGSSKSTFNIDVGGIHIEGAGKGADELTEAAVSLLFERVALSQGL